MIETWTGLGGGFRGGGGIVRGVEVGGFGLEAIHQQQRLHMDKGKD